MPAWRKTTRTIHIPLPESAGRELEIRLRHVPQNHSPVTAGYAYTLGLQAGARHPEIIVFGLKQEHAMEALEDLAKRIVTGKETFRTNLAYTDIFQRHRAVFHEITSAQARKYLGQTEAKGHVLKALQLIWPDRNDRFPWEPGFEEHLRRLQPVLGVH